MSNFQSEYASLYNSLYSKKNYSKEAEYVDQLFKKYSKIPVKKILDLGCGTGKHAEQLCENYGYNILGIDRSFEMVNLASSLRGPNSDKLKFLQSNIIQYELKASFEGAVSLFHVFSYLVENEDIQKALNCLRRHLENGALFIFDFWYGPGVLTDLPKNKIKNLNEQGLKAYRITEPILDTEKNLVEVYFKNFIIDSNNNAFRQFDETHPMRYFFLPELKMFLKESNFKMVEAFQWETLQPLTKNCWYGVLVCQAV